MSVMSAYEVLFWCCPQAVLRCLASGLICTLCFSSTEAHTPQGGRGFYFRLYSIYTVYTNILRFFSCVLKLCLSLTDSEFCICYKTWHSFLLGTMGFAVSHSINKTTIVVHTLHIKVPTNSLHKFTNNI